MRGSVFFHVSDFPFRTFSQQLVCSERGVNPTFPWPRGTGGGRIVHQGGPSTFCIWGHDWAHENRYVKSFVVSHVVISQMETYGLEVIVRPEDGKNSFLIIYPLVNCPITMERSTIFHGKTHYKWWFSIVMGQFTRGYYDKRPEIWCDHGERSVLEQLDQQIPDTLRSSKARLVL